MSAKFYRLNAPTFPFTSSLGKLDGNQKKMMSKLRKFTHNLEPYKEMKRIREFCEKDNFYYRNLSVTSWKEEDLKELEECVEEALEWRKEVNPEAKKIEPMIDYAKKNGLENFQGIFHFGYDKECRPLIYMNLGELARIKRDQEGKDFIFDLVVVVMEDIYRQGHLNINLVMDVSGVGFSFCSFVTSIGKKFSKFGSYYCGSMHKAYVINAGWALRAIWKVAKLFMHPHSQAKMNFEKDANMIKTIIDEENIPKEFGGKNPMKFNLIDYFELLIKERKEREKKKDEDSEEEEEEEEEEDADEDEDTTEET